MTPDPDQTRRMAKLLRQAISKGHPSAQEEPSTPPRLRIVRDDDNAPCFPYDPEGDPPDDDQEFWDDLPAN